MRTIIRFILLIILYPLLTRDAYTAAQGSTNRSASIFLGDSVCQRRIQEDITTSMKYACAEKFDDKYTSMATNVETLAKRISDLHLILLSRPNTTLGVCPRGYQYYRQDKFCYSLRSECKSWPQARQICLQEGGDLISLTESNFYYFMDLSRTETGECRSVWVGTTDVTSEGQWFWLNGVRVESVFWAQGQPDNWASKENCGDLSDIFDYKLNDEDCSKKTRFICQRA